MVLLDNFSLFNSQHDFAQQKFIFHKKVRYKERKETIEFNESEKKIKTAKAHEQQVA